MIYMHLCRSHGCLHCGSKLHKDGLIIIAVCRRFALLCWFFALRRYILWSNKLFAQLFRLAGAL